MEKNEPVITQEAVDVCKAWIRKFGSTRKTLNRGYTSYYLKHAVERFSRERGVDCYVPHRAFIWAALQLGYTAKGIDSTGVSIFNMSHDKEAFTSQNLF